MKMCSQAEGTMLYLLAIIVNGKDILCSYEGLRLHQSVTAFLLKVDEHFASQGCSPGTCVVHHLNEPMKELVHPTQLLYALVLVAGMHPGWCVGLLLEKGASRDLFVFCRRPLWNSRHLPGAALEPQS